MRRWKRWAILAGVGLAGVAILYVVFSLVFLEFVIDYLWFQSLGYGGYFGLRLIYRYAVFGGVTLIFFLLFFLNFWVASRYLGASGPPEPSAGAGKLQKYHDLVRLFRSGSLKVYTPLALVLGILIAYPLFDRWEAALFYVFGGKTGIQDPSFGKDVSYFLFSFPIYTLLQRRLLIAFLLLLLGLVLLYWLEGRVLSQQEQPLPRGAKVHLSVLVLLIFFIEIWDYRLQSYRLLYTSTHPLFYGPGFVEMRVILPLIWLTLLLLMGTAFSLIFLINTRKGWKTLIIFTACFFLALGARRSAWLPGFVDKYFVKPNEISREKPYIANSIQATLAAYNLTQIETREYAIKRVPSLVTDPNVRQSLRNIPVWDRDLLVEVYKQLQEIRPYYEFGDADVDRYTVRGLYQQVFVAPREINILDLPLSAQNWVNEHLKYTHGYGAVMTPAAQDGGEPMTWFIHNLPPQSDYGFDIRQPAIYYGLQSYGYAIAPNESQEFGYPEENTTVNVNYQGTGGVRINSLFRKLLFATYFKNRDIFFTAQTIKDSRILFRRNIIEAIRTVTPYFRLDSDPYAVMTAKGIFWVQDAYTTSDWFPNAQPYDQQLNYIRNAAKIVVDAYNGSISYYIADPNDPIIRAYRRMYPGLFQDLGRMDAELKEHLRYPRDMLEIQMNIYTTYHQTDPETFYKQEDAWQFARSYQGDQPVPIRPEFLTLNLIREDKHEFILLSPMSPKNLDVLRALVVVGCDGSNYGKIIVYSFPRGMVVYGPSQIDALINQDPVISQQFTLWDQAGSQLQRGNTIILPIGGTVLYIQPIYLKSAARLKIPELQRLIVSQGDIVVMDSSLEKALQTLEERLRARFERIEQRLQQYQTPGQPPPEPPRQEPAPSAQ